MPRSRAGPRSPADEVEQWRNELRGIIATRPKRRRPLRAIGVLLLVVVVAAAACAALTYRYATNTLAHIARQPCPACGRGDPGAITILFIGSDSRADIPKAEAMHFCERADCSDMAGPEHSDAIMILRIFGSQHRASLLSIPRDLNVSIAGTGRRDRINVAYEGGPQRLVETIRNDFGIPIDHVIDADFVGFRSIVGVLGGLDVYFPTPTRDAMSGLSVPRAGCIHLDGNATLAYVRSRHTQFFEDGRWRSDPLSDLSRVKRQQDFMRRLIRRIEMIRNPFVARRVIDSSIHFFKLDDGFSFWDALRLVRALRGVAPETLQATTIPVDNITVGGASELRLLPQATAVIDGFLRGPSPGTRSAVGAAQVSAAAPSAAPEPAARC